MHKAIILFMLTEIQQKVCTKYFSYVRDFFSHKHSVTRKANFFIIHSTIHYLQLKGDILLE